MSGNHLNDLSKIYLDKVYKNNTETAEADKSRWEDLGGPTPDNYRSDDNSAKLKEDYETTKKREVLAAFKRDPKVRKRFEKAAKKEGGPGSDKNRAADDMLQTAKDIVKRKGDTSKSDDRYAYESFSDWRQDLAEQDLIEIVDGPEDKVEKKVKEKKVTNKIVINPKLSEAISEMGGEVLELTEVEEKEEPKEDPALKSKEKKASMLKKQVLIKKLQAVRAGGADITASYEPDIDGVIEYFYEEGINEEGFDQLIEEIGLEEFVDFVEGGIVELNEERAARRASVRAPSYEKVKAKVDAADAAKKKAKKGEYATSYAKKETDVTVYDDKPAAKKKAPAKKTVVKKAAPKPAPKKVAKKDYDGDGKKEAPKAEHRGVRNKAITKAVAKVKKTQPAKKATKQGLGDKIRGAYKAGVKRHRKATQGARVFGKGFAAGAKKAVKFAKDVKKVVSEEELLEAERKLADRLARKRKLYDKTTKKAMQFARDEGEASGHARYRMSSISREMDGIKAKMNKEEVELAMEAKVDQGRSDYGKASIRNYRRKGPGHGEPAMFDPENKRGKLIDKRREEHKARRGVKGAKVPAYKVNEADDKAYNYVVSKLKKKYGDDAVITKTSKPKPPSDADKAKAAAERKKRQDADNKAYAARAKKAGFKSTQNYTDVVARYGSEDNFRKGKGLGT